MPDIANNITRISERIDNVVKKCHRARSEITLLAVSKGQPATAINTAYQCGLRHFGESYLQESLPKMDKLAAQKDIIWHFIGPLQNNKTRKITERFDWVHSIDRIKTADRLSGQRPPEKPPLNVCLQVNIDNEPTKAGVATSALPELAMAVAKLPGLRLRGLMVIPKPSQHETQQREAFARSAALLDELRQLDPALAALDTLSMGMSADLEAAIGEGATIVRIGTDIFGSRIFGSRQSVSKSHR